MEAGSGQPQTSRKRNRAERGLMLDKHRRGLKGPSEPWADEPLEDAAEVGRSGGRVRSTGNAPVLTRATHGRNRFLQGLNNLMKIANPRGLQP